MDGIYFECSTPQPQVCHTCQDVELNNNEKNYIRAPRHIHF